MGWEVLLCGRSATVARICTRPVRFESIGICYIVEANLIRDGQTDIDTDRHLYQDIIYTRVRLVYIYIYIYIYFHYLYFIFLYLCVFSRRHLVVVKIHSRNDSLRQPQLPYIVKFIAEIFCSNSTVHTSVYL